MGRLQERRVPVPPHGVLQGIGGGPLAQTDDTRVTFIDPLVHQRDDGVLVGRPDLMPIRLRKAVALACRQVGAAHVPTLGLGPHEVVIFHVLDADEAVTAADGRPVILAQLPLCEAAGGAPRAIVL